MTSDAKKELNVLAATVIRGIRFIVYPLLALLILFGLRSFGGFQDYDQLFRDMQNIALGALFASLGKLVAEKTTNSTVKKVL